MDVIKQTLDSLKFQSPTTFRNLTVYPLILKNDDGEAAYQTLDEALLAKTVKITEVSDGGSVPDLQLQNNGDQPVLVIDGEEMVGAKQNRVINLTVMVGDGTKVVIPVSCVEAGRWHYASPDFESSPQAMHASGRLSKMAGVTYSMREHDSYRSNQGEVWDDISAKMSRLEARSPSSEMKAIFERHGATIDDFVRAFKPLEGQAGAVFAIGNKIVGLELFDHPRTLGRLLPKLVRSYALDAIDVRYAGQAAEVDESRLLDEARLFLSSVGLAEATSHPAIGLGEDIRISTRSVLGAALSVNAKVVHLSAFPKQDQSSEHDHGRYGRMTSASARRGFREN